MNIMFLDIETTGIPGQIPNDELKITEIAWAVYSTKHKRVFCSQQHIVDELQSNQTISEEVEALTGINTNLVNSQGSDFDYIANFFHQDAKLSDAYFARNGINFDIPILKKAYSEIGLKWREMPIIDDYYDIPYPPEFKGRNLSHVACDHGFVNPFPHNALGDVLTMISVVERGDYDLVAAFEKANTDLVDVQAQVSFAEKDLAKDAGFLWDPQCKVWSKTMRAADQHSFAFKTESRPAVNKTAQHLGV